MTRYPCASRRLLSLTLLGVALGSPISQRCSAQEPKPRAALERPDPVWSVAFSQDGTWLATGSGAKGKVTSGEASGVQLWDVKTGELKRTLTVGPRYGGIGGPVKSLAFSPDGRLLACDGRPDTVMLWGSHTGEVKQKLAGPKGRIWWVAFSRDGKSLASTHSSGAVKLWDVQTGEVKRLGRGHRS